MIDKVPNASHELSIITISQCWAIFLSVSKEFSSAMSDYIGCKHQLGLPVAPFYPSALRAGGVLSSRSGRAGGWTGGCQICGTHISVTAWRIFSIRSSVELSRPVGVHCHSHMPICPIWACPWAKNLSNEAALGSDFSNFPQIGSRLCGTHISETVGWIYPI